MIARRLFGYSRAIRRTGDWRFPRRSQRHIQLLKCGRQSGWSSIRSTRTCLENMNFLPRDREGAAAIRKYGVGNSGENSLSPSRASRLSYSERNRAFFDVRSSHKRLLAPPLYSEWAFISDQYVLQEPLDSCYVCTGIKAIAPARDCSQERRGSIRFVRNRQPMRSVPNLGSKRFPRRQKQRSPRGVGKRPLERRWGRRLCLTKFPISP